MGKVVSRGGPASVRKPAPSRGKVISRTASGRSSAPAHDPLPYPTGKGQPAGKAWCKKCAAWRFFRRIRAATSAGGLKGRLGNCVQCGTEHFFRPHR